MKINGVKYIHLYNDLNKKKWSSRSTSVMRKDVGSSRSTLKFW